MKVNCQLKQRERVEGIVRLSDCISTASPSDCILLYIYYNEFLFSADFFIIIHRTDDNYSNPVKRITQTLNFKIMGWILSFN